MLVEPIAIMQMLDSRIYVIVLETGQKTIHQVTTTLATSKNVQFPGHNHLLTTGADDPSF